MYFDELRDAFHMRLGRLTHVVGQLDLNVGLALNWLGQNNDLDISNLLDPAKARLSLRLNMLKKLVDITFDQRTPQTAADFSAWFNRVNNAPALKNNYVHAHWTFCGLLDGEEPYVLFKAMSWNMRPDQADNSVKLTLKEFDQHIDELKRLNFDFGKICDCHAEHATPVAPVKVTATALA